MKGLSIGVAAILLPLSGFALTVEQAICHVIATHPQMKEGIEVYRATAHDIDMAKSGYLPRIDGQLRYGRENTTTPTIDDIHLTRRDAQIKLTQNVFDGFGTVADVKKQEARTEAAKNAVFEKANQLSLQTAEAYLEVLKQYDFLQLAQNNLKIYQDIHAKISERTKSGFGSKAEQDQSFGRVALANSNVIIQQSNYRDAMTKFERLYGEKVAISEFVKPKFTYTLPTSYAAALSGAQENYPSLAVQNYNIAAAEHNVKVATKTYYPRIDLELAKSDNKNVNGYRGPNEIESAMIIASYNFYNGGYYEANRLKQKVMIMKEREQIGDIKLRVTENLGYAWTAYEELQKQIPYLLEHRNYTTQTLESYRQEFALGRRTLLDILNTENERFGAEKEVARSEYDLLFAKYRVMEGTGNLAKEIGVLPAL